jgi:hypothetical protein
MPVLPTGVESTPTTFTPAFAYVAQTNDFDDVFAGIAMISCKKIEEVRDVAIAKTWHPARGPFYMGEPLTATGIATAVISDMRRRGRDPGADRGGIGPAYSAGSPRDAGRSRRRCGVPRFRRSVGDHGGGNCRRDGGSTGAPYGAPMYRQG